MAIGTLTNLLTSQERFASLGPSVSQRMKVFEDRRLPDADRARCEVVDG